MSIVILFILPAVYINFACEFRRLETTNKCDGEIVSLQIWENIFDLHE